MVSWDPPPTTRFFLSFDECVRTTNTPSPPSLPFVHFEQSGISPTDDALDTYQKLSRSKIQYIIFKIDKVDGMESIVVEKTGEKGEQDEKRNFRSKNGPKMKTNFEIKLRPLGDPKLCSKN